VIAAGGNGYAEHIVRHLQQFWYFTSVTVTKAQLPKDIFAPCEDLATIV
jgi:hypothetical protein